MYSLLERPDHSSVLKRKEKNISIDEKKSLLCFIDKKNLAAFKVVVSAVAGGGQSVVW